MLDFGTLFSGGGGDAVAALTGGGVDALTAAFNGGLTDVMNLPTELMNALLTVIGHYLGVVWTNFGGDTHDDLSQDADDSHPPVAT